MSEYFSLATWILVIVLSLLLLAVLVLSIKLLRRFIVISREIEKIIITGQGIASKTDDIIENVHSMTTVGGLFKTVIGKYLNVDYHQKGSRKGGQNGQKK